MDSEESNVLDWSFGVDRVLNDNQDRGLSLAYVLPNTGLVLKISLRGISDVFQLFGIDPNATPVANRIVSTSALIVQSKDCHVHTSTCGGLGHTALSEPIASTTVSGHSQKLTDVLMDVLAR